MAVQRRGWRYFATRLNGDGTETMLDIELPLENVSIEDVLSGDNALSGEIEPVYRRLKGADGLPVLRPWHTAIYAENNGLIRGGGILTGAPRTGPRLSLEAVGFTGYLRDLPWTGDVPVTNNPPGWNIAAGKDGSGLGVQVDPIDMVRVIWGYAQRQTGGNLNFQIDTTKSNKKIGTTLAQIEFDTESGPVSFEAGPYKLNWYSNHDLAGDIDALAAETPFDYHERHYWDGDTIVHRLDIGFPKIGRRREDLTFTFGVNIYDPAEVEQDGELYASGTMVLGAGDGPSMIHSIKEPPTRPPGLRRIATVIDDTIKTKTKASARANAENQWRSRLDDVSSVGVVDHPDAPLGAAQVGDEIRIGGPGDWGDIDMWVRILAITIDPAAGNVAEYSIARTDKLMS